MKKSIILPIVFANLLFSQSIKSFDDLQNFIKDGWERGYFPKAIISHQGTKTRLKDINLEFRNALLWNLNARCNPHKNEVIIANENYDDSIMCDGNDNIYILNGGNNELDDPTGDDIVVLGNGNDKIKLSGSAIIVAQNGFGHNEIEFREPVSIEYVSTHGFMQGDPYLTQLYKNIIGGYDGSFPYEFHHFIVFGEGIKRADLSWDNDTLINLKTGDSIKLNTKSVNLLFKDDENPKIDTKFIKSAFKPYELNLQNIKIDKIYENGDFIYLATQFGNLKQAKLTDYKMAKIQKEIWTKEFIANIAFSDDFIFVSEWSNDELGFLNIFDKSLNLIKRLTFEDRISDIKVHKNILYLLHNVDFHEHEILVFDIEKMELLETLKVPHLLSFEIIDNFLFATHWSKGISVFDISEAKKPVKFANFNDISAINFKKYNDFIAILQDKGIFGIYKFNQNSLDKNCEINLPKEENQREIFAKSPNSIFILDDIAFVANGEPGIFVIDLKKCEIKENLKITRWANSIFRLNDNLIVPGDEEVKFINLRKYFPNKKFIEFDKKESINLENSQNIEPELSKDKIQTLLFKSSYNNDYDEAMKYCKMGGDPNSKGHERTTPLEMAVNLKNINSAKAMLDCSKKAGDYAVMLSVFSTTKTNDEELAFLRLFEEYGGNFKAKDSSGCSMLNYAASHSSLEVIKFLIEKGADINARCRGNSAATPLDWAKLNPNPEVLEYLKNLQNQHKFGTK